MADAGREAAATSGRIESAGYRGLVLVMLLLVYTFNFIDRQILGILALPIKAEFQLTDTQLGLLSGIAFALFYTALGIPIAWLADRKSRTAIITVSLALWSLFTALCGVAGNFWQLFLARLGVGVGEAGGVAPTYALIADYFPRASRAKALAFYSLGIPIGSALGILLGGWIAATVDWRVAFISVGVAGLVLAPIFRLVVKEPVRGRFDPPQADAAAPPFRAVLSLLRRKPSFWLLAFGASCSSIVGYGMLFWTVSFFARTFDLPPITVSQIVGGITFVGGVAGVWAGGWLGDRLGASNPAAYGRVPALAYLIAVPFYVTGLLVHNLPVTILLFVVPVALALVWLGPVITAVQHLVPPSMRATASATFLFVNNLIGIGMGPLIIGFISDRLAPQFGSDALRYSILCVLVFYLLAAALMALASRHLAKDWND